MKRAFTAAEAKADLAKQVEDLGVRIVNDHDNDAFEQYYALKKASLLHSAWKVSRNDDYAEEALQDAMLKVLRLMEERRQGNHEHSFCHTPTYFNTWMHSIVINTAKRNINREDPDSRVSLSTTEEDPEDGYDQRVHAAVDSPWTTSVTLLEPSVALSQIQRRVAAAEFLEHLEQQALTDPSLRAVLTTTYTDDSNDGFPAMSYQERADADGVAIGTVRSRINRARVALRDKHDIDFN